MNIALTIDRIVIDGVALSPSESQRLRATLERELSQLLASGALAASTPLASERLRAPELQLSAAVSGNELGRELARSLHAAIAPQAPSVPATPMIAERDANQSGGERP